MLTEELELIPVKETLGKNEEFTNNPICRETIHMTTEFYKKVGYEPPWIGYYGKRNNDLLGSAAFKGKPIRGPLKSPMVHLRSIDTGE